MDPAGIQQGILQIAWPFFFLGDLLLYDETD
jgi:hypothetical protein